jgi:hypothetical protein
MAAEVKVKHFHALGKSEAKRRVDKGIDEVVDRMGLIETWEGNVMTLKGSGQSNGLAGRAEVREDVVVVELDVPDDLAPYADIYRVNVENFLIGILGPQAQSAT